MKLDYDLTILDFQCRRARRAGPRRSGLRRTGPRRARPRSTVRPLPQGPAPTLVDLCAEYGVAFERAHDAAADAEASVAVLGAIGRRFPTLHQMRLARLHLGPGELASAVGGLVRRMAAEPGHAAARAGRVAVADRAGDPTTPIAWRCPRSQSGVRRRVGDGVDAGVGPSGHGRRDRAFCSAGVLALSLHGRLAQLVAHLHDAQGVTGSSPVPPTTKTQFRGAFSGRPGRSISRRVRSGYVQHPPGAFGRRSPFAPLGTSLHRATLTLDGVGWSRCCGGASPSRCSPGPPSPTWTHRLRGQGGRDHRQGGESPPARAR